MSKVWATHMIALRPGVKANEFETFVKNEGSKIPMFDGWKLRLLKGERGERVDRYLMLIEIDNLETRNRFSPSENGSSPEADKFMKSHPEFGQLLDKWRKYVSALPGDGTIFTDYVEIG